MERYRRTLFLLLAVAVAIPVVLRSRPGRERPAPAASFVLSAPSGYVQVSGDVRHPGIYLLSANMLTSGVISMAEPRHPVLTFRPPVAGEVAPVSGDAYELAVSADGGCVVTKGGIPAAQRLVLGIPLDLNALSESDLDRLPGIGPGLARRIVQHRQNNGRFMTVEELQLVAGVGEKRFAGLRKYFQPTEIR